jgi:hypothetical protein
VSAHATRASFHLGHFARHYAEMVLAMVVGMMAYALVYGRGMAFTSYGDEAVMAAFMTAPMVAWMRYRGHSWRQSAEMSAAMLVPTAAVVVLMASRSEYGHAGACHPADQPADSRAADAG